jgi:uncharacterized protein (DUF433 family)
MTRFFLAHLCLGALAFPSKNLIDYLEAGDSLDEFLDDFPSVSRGQAI